jgi:predicted ATPase
LIISSGTGIIYKHAAGKNERQEIRLDSTTDLAITQIRDAASYTTLDKLRRYLANITVHRPFNTDDNSPIRNAQPIGVREAEVPPTRLSRGGENLTNVLYFMHNEPKYQDYYEEYLATLRRGFPSFEQLIFPADVGQGKTIMAWKDRYMPKRAITANLLSDGTLCFMCLLAALYDPEPPSILCIDEPEVSLHPQLIRLLASVLEEASDRMQIIVATHSPDLISALQNADDVVVAEAEDGWSTLKRLSQKDLQHWLQEYSLGELWESGEIGGRL